MSRTTRGLTAASYRSIGTTYDGVRILMPKTKPKRFTTAQLRATMKAIVGDLHVERRPDGDFSVRREETSRGAPAAADRDV